MYLEEEDEDDFEDDEYIECGKPVYRDEKLMGYCIRHTGHVGPCANIILLR